jgi:hypothetical protein
MRTRDKLAAELRKIASIVSASSADKYEAFAKRAETGEFDDYADTYVCPITQLHSELKAAGFDKFAARVADGEFDATKEESDEWMAQSVWARGRKATFARDAQGSWNENSQLGDKLWPPKTSTIKKPSK